MNTNVVFRHLVPASTFGISPALNSVQGAFIVQDAERAIYAQVSASPIPAVKVGFIPAMSDGFGGIMQLARDMDVRYYSQQTTGFSTSLVGTTLTVFYPNVAVMWDGVVRTLPMDSISATVATGTYSLVVGYNWGLTQTQLLPVASAVLSGAYVELCQIVVNTTASTAVVQNGRIGCKFLQTLSVMSGGAAADSLIPASNGSGVMPW